jgi:hypothetical protein
MLWNLHTPSIAKESASRDFARWVDRYDGQAPIVSHRDFDQTRNQRAFADARRASDANDMSRNGMGGQFVEQGERLRLASGPAVFDKIQRRGDGFPLEAKKRGDVDGMVSSGHKDQV